MDLVIRIQDGKPFGNPIFVSHMNSAFPEFTTNPLPEGYAEFIRKEPAEILDRFMVREHSYGWEGPTVTDVYTTRPMTEEEKQAEIAALKQLPPHPSRYWDEESLSWERCPMPPRPDSGGPWKFDAESWSFVIATKPPFPSWVLRDDGLFYRAPVPRPQDGKPYRWDEPTLSWVALNV